MHHEEVRCVFGRGFAVCVLHGFTGAFDGGMLDVSGSGRITLTAFWEQDGHQYATGSFMWPSGETEVIVLVRP